MFFFKLNIINCIIFPTITILIAAAVPYINKFFNKYIIWLIFYTQIFLIYKVLMYCMHYTIWQSYNLSNASQLDIIFKYDLVLFNINNIEFSFNLHVTPFNLVFLLLTVFIFPLCTIYHWNQKIYNKKYLLLLLLLLELIIFIIFTINDIFLFYIFFELSLVPMIFIIAFWGSRKRKIKAIFYFFLYTLMGSFLLLLSILYLINKYKTANYEYILWLQTEIPLTILEEKLLWLGFFFGFGVKIPIIPFHIWLPEAHVEAPTSGSVILASLLLKLGGFGLIKFTIPLLTYANIYFSNIINIICIISIIYSSLTAIRQIDLKRIVAYSSVSHMNFVVLGIYTLNFEGIFGAIVLMLGHGIISSALFFLIGMLYDRYHTKYLKYYGGISQIMPIFSFFLFFFIFSNISFPGTANFIGEFIIFIGLFKYNKIITFFLGLSIIFTLFYNILLFNNVCFGKLNINYIKTYKDLTYNEFLILFNLLILTFYIGLYSENIYYFLKDDIIILLKNYK